MDSADPNSGPVPAVDEVVSAWSLMGMALFAGAAVMFVMPGLFFGRACGATVSARLGKNARQAAIAAAVQFEGQQRGRAERE